MTDELIPYDEDQIFEHLAEYTKLSDELEASAAEQKADDDNLKRVRALHAMVAKPRRIGRRLF